MQGHEPEHDPEDWDDLPDLSDFPDPWEGDHNIEYWVWDGVRLIPATPAQRARIQEDERTQAARRRLKHLQEREQRAASRSAHGLAGVREAVARVWRLWRRGTRPATSSLETHQTAISPHQPSGER